MSAETVVAVDMNSILNVFRNFKETHENVKNMNNQGITIKLLNRLIGTIC